MDLIGIFHTQTAVILFMEDSQIPVRQDFLQQLLAMEVRQAISWNLFDPSANSQEKFLYFYGTTNME